MKPLEILFVACVVAVAVGLFYGKGYVRGLREGELRALRLALAQYQQPAEQETLNVPGN